MTGSRGQQPQLSCLDNGVIRLGVSLNPGGAITYPSNSNRGLMLTKWLTTRSE